MATDVRTMNLSDNGDGMVSLNNNQGTSFVPNIPPEKNVSENKQTMDSTSISDIMSQVEEPLEPPMMGADPRMAQMQMQAPMMMAQQQPVAQQQTTEKQPESKNPSTLLMTSSKHSLLLFVLRRQLVSQFKKTMNFVPSFLNDQGHRSAISLASTGVVAAVAFYIIKDTLKWHYNVYTFSSQI